MQDCYLLEKQGSKYLVDSSDLKNITATLVVESSSSQVEQFCLLDEIKPTVSSVSEVELASVEGKFVRHCFETTIGNKSKVIKVEKVKNKTV
jgi:hypothetical protein